MYEGCIKRILDFVISLFAVIVLFPVFLMLTVLGFWMMKGNPFFIQKRPGQYERVFKLIKFRTMDNRRDENGELLPDKVRLNAYGRFLRITSLDELPELFNILKGDMSLIGPRPLLIQYLPYYTRQERQRHNVRPGLTGLAQVNGRNNLKWDERLAYDVQYVQNISFKRDMAIFMKTIQKVFEHSDIQVDTENEGYLDEIRRGKTEC